MVVVRPPPKESALRFAEKMAPLYAEVFHELKHNELLDLCDSARLDRFQNRIEDVNYLTKGFSNISTGRKRAVCQCTEVVFHCILAGKAGA